MYRLTLLNDYKQLYNKQSFNYLKQTLEMKYSIFWGNYLNYNKYNCSYKCSLSQKLYKKVKGRICTWTDVIVPLIIIAFVQQREKGLQKIFENVFESYVFSNIKEDADWIDKRERQLGHKGTNGFKVFKSIIAVTHRYVPRVVLAQSNFGPSG